MLCSWPELFYITASRPYAAKSHYWWEAAGGDIRWDIEDMLIFGIGLFTIFCKLSLYAAIYSARRLAIATISLYLSRRVIWWLRILFRVFLVGLAICRHGAFTPLKGIRAIDDYYSISRHAFRRILRSRSFMYFISAHISLQSNFPMHFTSLMPPQLELHLRLYMTRWRGIYESLMAGMRIRANDMNKALDDKLCDAAN